MESLPIVPFGKYKNKPVTDLLNDKKYLDWCKNQDWFSKFPVIYNICVNQTIQSNNLDAPTPEHNKLQNLFLHKKNQISLVYKLMRLNFMVNELEKIYPSEKYNLYFGIQRFTFNFETDIEFEGKFNWDFILSVDWRNSHTDIISNMSPILSYNHSAYELFTDIFKDIPFLNYYSEEKMCIHLGMNKKIYCEIKTLLGDDYPCVLRKMKNQILLTRDNRALYALIIKEFNSSSTSKDELLLIFKQANIKIIFIDEIISGDTPNINSCSVDDFVSIKPNINLDSDINNLPVIEAKDTLENKLLKFIEYGRKEITSKKELEKFPIGSILSYMNINNQFKQGGFIIKFADDYFIFITLDFSTKYRVRYKNVSKMWAGDVFNIHNDFISFTESSQKKTNFPVKINDSIIYYATSDLDKKDFMSTDHYKKLINWYNYFISNPN